MSTRRVTTMDFDWITFAVYVLLALIGWAVIYSAVYEEGLSPFELSNRAGKQLLWIGTSILIFGFIMAVNYRTIIGISYSLYAIVMLLLVLVFIIGVEVNGAKAWFVVGGFRLQPSEFAKFSTCLVLASFMSRFNFDMSLRKHRLQLVGLILLPMILIALENDIGNALIYTSLVLVLYRFGLPGSYLLIAVLAIAFSLLIIFINKLFIIIGLAVLALIFVFANKKYRGQRALQGLAMLALASAFIFLVDFVYHDVLTNYQRNRIELVLGVQQDLKDQGYNLHQSLIAIGSGGIFGKGYLNGTQTKFRFVPEQSTDFIFCTIGEEFGFFGTFVILMLFGILLFRIIIIAERQSLAFVRIYAYGLASIIFFHVLVNVGMTIGLFPVIGLPLPLLSYGGSALWSFTIMLAILLKFDSIRRIVLS